MQGQRLPFVPAAAPFRFAFGFTPAFASAASRAALSLAILARSISIRVFSSAKASGLAAALIEIWADL